MKLREVTEEAIADTDPDVTMQRAEMLCRKALQSSLKHTAVSEEMFNALRATIGEAKTKMPVLALMRLIGTVAGMTLAEAIANYDLDNLNEQLKALGEPNATAIEVATDHLCWFADHAVMHAFLVTCQHLADLDDKSVPAGTMH